MNKKWKVSILFTKKDYMIISVCVGEREREREREPLDQWLILTHSSICHLPFFSLWGRGEGHEINITLNSSQCPKVL